MFVILNILYLCRCPTRIQAKTVEYLARMPDHDIQVVNDVTTCWFRSCLNCFLMCSLASATLATAHPKGA